MYSRDFLIIFKILLGPGQFDIHEILLDFRKTFQVFPPELLISSLEGEMAQEINLIFGNPLTCR